MVLNININITRTKNDTKISTKLIPESIQTIQLNLYQINL